MQFLFRDWLLSFASKEQKTSDTANVSLHFPFMGKLAKNRLSIINSVIAIWASR